MSLVSLQNACTGMLPNSMSMVRTGETDRDIVKFTVYFPDYPGFEFRILDYYTDNKILPSASSVTDIDGCGTISLNFPWGTRTVYARVCDSWAVGNECSTINTDTNTITFSVIPSPSISPNWLLLGLAVVALGSYYFVNGTRKRVSS